MKRAAAKTSRRATILLMVVGLLAMLFMIVTAYIALARFDRSTNLQARSGQLVEQTLAAMTDVLTASLTRGAGSNLVTGEGYADIPGYRNGASISAAEPVLKPLTDLNNTRPAPSEIWLPGVTSLNGDVGPKTVDQLAVRDPNRAAGSATVVVNPFNPDAANTDTKHGARWPLTDAFGIGIPNSHFGGTSRLTELANTVMSGTAVATQNLDLTKFNLTYNPADPANSARSQHFDQQARYVAAAKILPHGGMVLVGSSGATAWNSQFTAGMFNWIRSPQDKANTPLLDPAADAAKLAAVTASRAAIEPSLRIRGSLLIEERTGRVVDDQDWSILPPALRALQANRFDATFTPIYVSAGGTSLKTSNYERFNIAAPRRAGTDGPEWTAWWKAATLSPDLYNQWFQQPAQHNPRDDYNTRHLLTAENNSDEAARKQTVATPAGADLRLQPGDRKFYLGRIAQAFDVNGRFLGGQGALGTQIVHELAEHFHEMLAGYTGWFDPNNPTALSEAVTRRQQALMLAVDLVASGAPRSAGGTAGFIDNVWYLDADPNDPVHKMYVGYAPQPFITQVLAYKKEDPGKIALVVELFNPNEQFVLPPQGQDTQALYLQAANAPPQFALSLNDEYEADQTNQTKLRPLANNGSNSVNFPQRLGGRDFMIVIVNDSGGNDYFETHIINGGTKPIIKDLTVNGFTDPQNPSRKIIAVKLWRRGLSGPPWVLVDQIQIEEPKDSTGNPAWPGSWVDGWRDTNTEPYWGVVNFPGGPREARWRCAVAFEPQEPDTAEHNDNEEPTTRLADLGKAGPKLDPTGNLRLGPTAPLYTMNASGSVVLDGAARPASFPTVGFTLFAPRFSHFGPHDGTQWIFNPTANPPLRPHPMSDVLRQQWDRKKYTLLTAPPQGQYPVPVDFGHMPIFDNRQTVASDSEFYDDPNNPNNPNNRTGRIPWGLLVFDYFTTLNLDPDGRPNSGDEIDPDRVPGRININDAPWYVLAGFPVIGPIAGGTPNLPLAPSTSPAFWLAQFGILAGQGADGNFRFAPKAANTLMYPDDPKNPNYPGQTWYRLGPYLAQTAAAYRDRLPYVREGPNPPALPYTFPFTEYRNNALHPYRFDGRYGVIRGEADNLADPANSFKWKRGFLSIGELANVMGFDSSTATETQTWQTTVLGRYNGFGDFYKAVSLLALLDTHFLTTRSNTFTVYATLTDRVNPQASVRSQVTIDRGKLLPRVVKDANGQNASVGIQNNGDPELIGQRQVAYFNARYDD